ncbi:MAG: CRISPR-associated endonuclease Cas1, partial [Myxococcales bacterium]|nr:CRISPR-associated endonuclease Cas1 [Myxococcales bacterium]
MSDPSPGQAPDGVVPELVPARMLNEHAYCPRLAYLEWVQGDFADSADTVEGRFHHRNVDRESGVLPSTDPEAEPETLHARSVMLSAPRLGMIARIDLVEAEGIQVTPVDYKRGAAPDVPGGAWEPERVQLCAQALILEEHGYQVERGYLYFVASRQRVEIVFDGTLRARTRELLDELRASAAAPVPPPPLSDSPRCPRCSLVGICLPDEVNLLRAPPGPGIDVDVRRLVPARDDALPLYVQAAGARIGKRGDELVVEERDGTRHEARLGATSQVAVFGGVQVTTQAIQTLCDRSIPLVYFSAGGWFYGITRGLDHKHVELRRHQYRVADDPRRSFALARRLVSAKIRNCRTLLRRNAAHPVQDVLDRLKELAESVADAAGPENLLGIEGTAARLYFEGYARLIKESGGGPTGTMGFDFDGRNRRPPRDPVNALLSLAYSLLTKDVLLAAFSVGFDPYLGFYHRPRYGRPALALDVMEEFRPLIADSVVLS